MRGSGRRRKRALMRMLRKTKTSELEQNHVALARAVFPPDFCCTPVAFLLRFCSSDNRYTHCDYKMRRYLLVDTAGIPVGGGGHTSTMEECMVVHSVTEELIAMGKTRWKKGNGLDGV
jgi:hypothetical protein